MGAAAEVGIAIPDIPNINGCSSTAHPDDKSGIDCFPDIDGCGGDEVDDTFDKEPAKLKEYTYAVEAGALNLGRPDENCDLSHRSNASDIERQALFRKRRQEVAKRIVPWKPGGKQDQQNGSRPIVFPRLPLDENVKEGDEAQRRSEHLLSEYKALGINIK